MDMDCSNVLQNRDNDPDFVRKVINIRTNQQTKPNNQPVSQPTNQIKKTTKPTNPQKEPTKPTDRPTDRPTDQPTPWSRVLLEKLTGLQLRKKFPVFYRTWTPRIVPIVSQSNPGTLSHPISLSSHLLPGIPSDLFPSSFRTKALCAFLLSPCMPHISQN